MRVCWGITERQVNYYQTFSMHYLWSDDYWLLLMQLYLKKPIGIKPLYSRAMVDLSLALHIPPQALYEQMFKLRRLDTPRLEKLWKEYTTHPNKLARDVKRLRKMHGFGKAETFYDGVEINESFEQDFQPLKEDEELMPIMLIIILDLYFRLIPMTMVSDTPEIIKLAKQMRLKPQKVVEVMEVFQFCDPYLNSENLLIHPLLAPCQEIWQRYGNTNPEQLAALASQLKDYF